MREGGRPKVLLIGWDAADWQIARPLMDRGEMPVLRRLVQLGVHGPLRTLEPMLSPMLWTSIATGKRAYDHGVHGFTEVCAQTGRVTPVTAATRQVKALWNMLSERGLRSHVVGWFATHGEADPNVHLVSDAYPHPTAPPGVPWPPAPRGTFAPARIADPLNDLRVSPEEVDASMVAMLCPRWEDVDQEQDDRLGHLRGHLAECLSVQAAATWLLEHEPWDLAAVYFRAIDDFAHHFMAFHPPRLEAIPEDLFELYRDVMRNVYRLHDALLASLIARAGEGVTVILVSDHGFKSDHTRPRWVPKVPAGIAVWHRTHGVFAAAGPGLRRGAPVAGVGLLDIAPTVLQLFGLPVGEDMEGRVIAEAFSAPPRVAQVPTWETGASRETRTSLLTTAESEALLERFVALGYVEAPSRDPGRAATNTRRELDWNLARACLDGRRFERALPLLEDVFHQAPDRSDVAHALARCQQALGLREEAREALERLVAEAPEGASGASLLRAQIAALRGDHADELRHLRTACAPRDPGPVALVRLGAALLRARRWDEAATAFRRALERQAEDADAWAGLARAELRRGRDEAALEAAMTAVELRFADGRAHLEVALPLLRSGDLELARSALELAVRSTPGLRLAHRLLAWVLQREGRAQAAESERDRYRQILAARRARRDATARIREEARERAARRGPTPARGQATDPVGEAPSSAPVGDRAATSDASGADTGGSCEAERELVVVSGVPRSGTSLLMQMLRAGGLPPMSDGVRAADAHNPEGYLEWEAVKRLPDDPRALDDAHGHAVKVVSPLLSYLPDRYRYRVVFVRRPLEEVVASQERMLGTDATPAETAQVATALAKHVDQVLGLLRASPQVALYEISYPDVLADPVAEAARLAGFLGDRLPHPERMAGVVRPDLYRHRSATSDR